MCQYSVFYGEYENEKKTGRKKFDLLRRGFEPRIFEQVPAQNLNLREIRSIVLTVLKKSQLYSKYFINFVKKSGENKW
jgi:hypothetical protein